MGLVPVARNANLSDRWRTTILMGLLLCLLAVSACKDKKPGAAKTPSGPGAAKNPGASQPGTAAPAGSTAVLPARPHRNAPGLLTLLYSTGVSGELFACG